MPGYKVLLLDNTDVIQHFLRSADRKCRDHDIAALIQRLLNHAGKFFHVIACILVEPTAVSALHDNIIRLTDVLRAANEWLVFVTDIT